MKLNRKLVLILSLVLSLALATGGTLAYLSDTDADVNVMTLGSVYIVQNEQERGADGNLVEFTNNKPMLPAVGTIAWDDEKLTIGEGEYKVFADELANVVDKIVTVTNTGKSDAYVRTIIAFEAPEGFDDALLHINYNAADVVMDENWAYVEIDGARYAVTSFTYRDVLAAGETSAPSLIQVFLDSKATNEDIEVLGDTYEILVLSQAVQTAGFDNAAAALNTAFGEANGENYAVWFKGLYVDGVVNEDMVGSPGDKNDTNMPPLMGDEWDGTADTTWYDENAAEYTLTTAEELAGLAELVNSGKDFSGKTIKLDGNIDLMGLEWTPIAAAESNAFEGTFDGQGNTISNLSINDEDGVDSALFGYAGAAEIKGINVRNVTIDAYSEAAAILGYGQGTTISDCHVSGDISIVTEWAYVGGIAAHGYMDIKDCSVIASGTGVIKSETRNAAGGICGWMWEGACEVTGCDVANLEITGWTNVGGITGFIHYGNLIDDCTATNLVITKTRVGGNPGIGLAAGGYSYSASNPSTISNNTFTNIELIGESKEFASYGILYGSEYGGTDAQNFILTNNTQTGIVDNTTIYVP